MSYHELWVIITLQCSEDGCCATCTQVVENIEPQHWQWRCETCRTSNKCQHFWCSIISKLLYELLRENDYCVLNLFSVSLEHWCLLFYRRYNGTVLLKGSFWAWHLRFINYYKFKKTKFLGCIFSLLLHTGFYLASTNGSMDNESHN